MSRMNEPDEWEERGVTRRLFVPDLASYQIDDQAELSADEQHYAKNVLRLMVGKIVELCDGKGLKAEAELTAAGKRGFGAHIRSMETVCEKEGPILAVSYCKRFDQMVEKATELGAKAIIPLLTDRTAVSYNDSKAEHLEKIILAALRQSGRHYLPELTRQITLRELLDKNLKVAAALPHGRGMHSLPELPECLLIGPEGGFSPAELQLLRDYKVAAYGLGPFILRVETAAMASLAAYWQCD